VGALDLPVRRLTPPTHTYTYTYAKISSPPTDRPIDVDAVPWSACLLFFAVPDAGWLDVNL
jgi:hypothetical protein